MLAVMMLTSFCNLVIFCDFYEDHSKTILKTKTVNHQLRPTINKILTIQMSACIEGFKKNRQNLCFTFVHQDSFGTVMQS